MKVGITILLLVLSLQVLGCVNTPLEDEDPILSVNLFQPLSTCDSEIEYKWEDTDGERRSYFNGQGNYCVMLLGKVKDSEVQARCVERDSSGNIINSGAWVRASVVEPKKLQSLCSLIKEREDKNEE